MAFRNATLVGNDSATSYYVEFLGIKRAESFEISWPNPGLPLVMKVIQFFTGDYQWVIIITAIWVCFAYYRLLVKYSENAFISVMWFMGMLFYTFMFSALKQAWAMSFLCFAFDAIFEKKPVRFLLLVVLASLFHFPALVFLLAYWIAKFKINKAFPLLMLFVLVVVFIFRSQILNLMISVYSNETEGSKYLSSVSFFGTKFVLMIIILGYAFYRYSMVGKGNMVFSALLYFMGFAAAIQTFCFYNNIFERLADYYYQFSILFMPLILIRHTNDVDLLNKSADSNLNTISNESTIVKKSLSNYTIEDIDISAIIAVVITVFCVWRFISITSSGMDSLTPFYFFWQSASTIS